jgi:DNA-binding NarL/FixJ family response regulator
VRVMLADDSALFRDGLAAMLVAAGFEISAAVPDAAALLAAISADPPDVAVVDIRMPPTRTDEGLQAAATIRSRHPGVGVLILSQYVDSHYALRLVDETPRGVGYLLKDHVADLAELTDAIRRVAAGGLVVDASVVAQLLGRRRLRNPLDDLSPRERDVLALMAQGRSNAAIGASLFLSEKTVEAHIRAVFTKLGLLADTDDNRRVRAVLTYLAADGDLPGANSPR